MGRLRVSILGLMAIVVVYEVDVVLQGRPKEKPQP